MARSFRFYLRKRLAQGAAIMGFFLLIFWLCFLDSHSLVKRIRWHQEYTQLTEENRVLRRQIEGLQHKLDQPLSDEVVERIAREQYGMRRPGETVYRIKKDTP